MDGGQLTLPERARSTAPDESAGRLGMFWRLQLAGWSAYLVVHFLGAVANDEPVTILWSSLATAVAGFALTSAMRSALINVWDRPAPQTAALALVMSLVLAIPFSAVSETTYYLAIGDGLRLDDPVTYFGSAFWCGSILLTWAGIYFGVEYYRQAQAERRLALEAEAIAHKAKLDALRYQLNPHFLFNTLNGISTLILDHQNRDAAEMVGRLAELLRESLRGRPDEPISLAEELRFSRLYLGIEQVRFGDRLEVEIDVEPAAGNVPVPRLLLQPLLENVIRHAVEPADSKVSLTLRAGIDDCVLRISIEDDGPGPGEASTSGTGIGLSNVSQRLRAAYRGRARLAIGARAYGGTRADIEIPLGDRS